MPWTINVEAAAIMSLLIILGVWCLVPVFLSFVEDYATFSIIAFPFIVTLFFLNPIIQVLDIVVPFIAEALQIVAIIIGAVILWQFFNLIWR